MKCSYAAFGEQNKTDNDSKCQNKRNTELTQNSADNFGTASSGNLHRKTINSRFSIQFSAAKVQLFFETNKFILQIR